MESKMDGLSTLPMLPVSSKVFNGSFADLPWQMQNLGRRCDQLLVGHAQGPTFAGLQ